MAERPTEYTVWASDETQVVEPAGGLKATGWTPGDAPPAQYFNWLFWLNDQWIQWLDQENQANTAEINHRAIADAAARPFSTGNILSGSHNWLAGCVSNVSGDDALVYPRYWVVGDDGAGNTAMAYGHAEVAGGSWADETGSAQAAAAGLDRCAAHGTLCMGIVRGTGFWKLGGTTNANGSEGINFMDITYDATNDLWVAATTTGVYTSPPTVISWTQRQVASTGYDFRAVYYDPLTATTYAVQNHTATKVTEVWTSTNGTTWTAAADTFTPTGDTESVAVCSEGIVITTDTAELLHTADFTGAGLEDRTPVGADPTGAVVCNDVICLPGIYMSYGVASAGSWKGAYFTAGVGTVLSSGYHAMIAVNGAAGAYLLGPMIHMKSVPFAV